MAQKSIPLPCNHHYRVQDIGYRIAIFLFFFKEAFYELTEAKSEQTQIPHMVQRTNWHKSYMVALSKKITRVQKG